MSENNILGIVPTLSVIKKDECEYKISLCDKQLLPAAS